MSVFSSFYGLTALQALRAMLDDDSFNETYELVHHGQLPDDLQLALPASRLNARLLLDELEETSSLGEIAHDLGMTSPDELLHKFEQLPDEGWYVAHHHASPDLLVEALESAVEASREDRLTQLSEQELLRLWPKLISDQRALRQSIFKELLHRAICPEFRREFESLCTESAAELVEDALEIRELSQLLAGDQAAVKRHDWRAIWREHFKPEPQAKS
jgi:hypothetical protein